MKRRLLSAFLAVMMVLTMAPVAFAADTSVDSYEGLVAALNTAKDGDTITVSGKIAIEHYEIGNVERRFDCAVGEFLWQLFGKTGNSWCNADFRRY